MVWTTLSGVSPPPTVVMTPSGAEGHLIFGTFFETARPYTSAVALHFFCPASLMRPRRAGCEVPSVREN
jgi:hypothetical protein